jgi:hypothetical protein
VPCSAVAWQLLRDLLQLMFEHTATADSLETASMHALCPLRAAAQDMQLCKRCNVIHRNFKYSQLAC